MTIEACLRWADINAVQLGSFLDGAGSDFWRLAKGLKDYQGRSPNGFLGLSLKEFSIPSVLIG